MRWLPSSKEPFTAKVRIGFRREHFPFFPRLFLHVLKPLLHTGICALFFLIVLPARAADPEKGNPMIDSLLRVIEQHPADSNGAKAYIGLAGEYLFENPQKAEQYCKESLRIARAAKWDVGIG